MSCESKVNLSELSSAGWTSCALESHTEYQFIDDLLTLAAAVATPISVRSGGFYEAVRPTPTNRSRKASLSRTFALDEFPFHADTAHWVVPCRYLVLGAFTPSNTCTELVDTCDLRLSSRERDLLHSAVFRIKNGRASFFGSILC